MPANGEFLNHESNESTRRVAVPANRGFVLLEELEEREGV